MAFWVLFFGFGLILVPGTIDEALEKTDPSVDSLALEITAVLTLVQGTALPWEIRDEGKGKEIILRNETHLPSQVQTAEKLRSPIT